MSGVVPDLSQLSKTRESNGLIVKSPKNCFLLDKDQSCPVMSEINLRQTDEEERRRKKRVEATNA